MSTTHTKMLTAAAKGERTLIETFLALAKVHPDRLYGSICLTQSETSEFRDFTVIELDQAVDRCAWTIKEQFGVVTDHETLLCLCESDFRYTIMFFAAIKCGYKVRVLDRTLQPSECLA
jgi:acyl-CoA synthetase (AMP-forming)/AMP-acid ligase II